MDFRRLEMFVIFRCFDLTGNEEPKLINVIDRFFSYYLYHLFYIITNCVETCSKIYLFGFALLKRPILAADSALIAVTQ